jgi:hypothetical protein
MTVSCRFAADIDELVFLRYEAEHHLAAIGLLEAPAYDPEDDVPF